MAPCRGLSDINNVSAVVSGATVVTNFKGTSLLYFWSGPRDKLCHQYTEKGLSTNRGFW